MGEKSVPYLTFRIVSNICLPAYCNYLMEKITELQQCYGVINLKGNKAI